VAHLKNCDPMMPGFMDWKAMKGQKKFGGAQSAPLTGKAAQAGKKGKKIAKKSSNLKRRKTKKATTVAA
jgi:hypothetical protein